MALWRKTTALAVPLTVITMMMVPAEPSHAALCNVGFVYGIAIDGSKVCVPLTKEVIGVLGATQAPAQPAPASPPQSTAPAPQPAPTAAQPQPTSTPAAATYVNSDSGNAVAVDSAGAFVDWNTTTPVQPSVVVPASALVPDAAVAATVKEQVSATPSSPARSESATPQAASPSASASGPSAPTASAAPPVEAVVRDSGPQMTPVVFGSTLVLLGLAAIYFAYRAITNSRNPTHGRRRAAN
jgi:hypothetical protein